MKIGLISDTHGDLNSFLEIEKRLLSYDLIIHTGDILNHGPRNPIPRGYNPGKLADKIRDLNIPFIWVKGNCDSEVDKLATSREFIYPYLFLMYNNTRIIATHGDLTFVNEDAKNLDVRIFISGHTHIPIIEEKENIIYINPGSTSIPKGKYGGSFGEIILEKEIAVNIYEISSGQKIYSEKFLF
jgi:putative phosphoesterase